MRVHEYCLKCEIVHLCHVIEESENEYLLKCDKDGTFSFAINKKHTSPEEEKQND